MVPGLRRGLAEASGELTVLPAAGEDAPALLSLSVLLGFLRAGACVCARVHVSTCIHVHTVEPGGREVDKWYPGALPLTCL